MRPSAVKVPMTQFGHLNLKLATMLVDQAHLGQRHRERMVSRDFCLSMGITPDQMRAFLCRNNYLWTAPKDAA